jgi:aspartyl-tRNA(Asn)/glutamyl-tRNA(Gln) amidotransferase subunit A
MPVGLQVMAPQFSEERLLQIGQAYQLATDWHKKFPAL